MFKKRLPPAKKRWNVYNYYYPKYDLSYAHCLYVTKRTIRIADKRSEKTCHVSRSSIIPGGQETMPTTGKMERNPWKRRVNSARRSFTFPADLEREESLYYFPRHDFTFHPFPVCRIRPAGGRMTSFPVDVVLEGDKEENDEELPIEDVGASGKDLIRKPKEETSIRLEITKDRGTLYGDAKTSRNIALQLSGNDSNSKIQSMNDRRSEDHALTRRRQFLRKNFKSKSSKNVSFLQKPNSQHRLESVSFERKPISPAPKAISKPQTKIQNVDDFGEGDNPILNTSLQTRAVLAENLANGRSDLKGTAETGQNSQKSANFKRVHPVKPVNPQISVKKESPSKKSDPETCSTAPTKHLLKPKLNNRPLRRNIQRSVDKLIAEIGKNSGPFVNKIENQINSVGKKTSKSVERHPNRRYSEKVHFGSVFEIASEIHVNRRQDSIGSISPATEPGISLKANIPYRQTPLPSVKYSSESHSSGRKTGRFVAKTLRNITTVPCTTQEENSARRKRGNCPPVDPTGLRFTRQRSNSPSTSGAISPGPSYLLDSFRSSSMAAEFRGYQTRKSYLSIYRNRLAKYHEFSERYPSFSAVTLHNKRCTSPYRRYIRFCECFSADNNNNNNTSIRMLIPLLAPP